MGRGFLGLEQLPKTWQPAVDVGVPEKEPESIRKRNDRQLRILRDLCLVVLIPCVIIVLYVKLAATSTTNMRTFRVRPARALTPIAKALPPMANHPSPAHAVAGNTTAARSTVRKS